MDILRQAAQTALEALEDMDSDDPELNQEWLGKKAIEALRAALAQPEKFCDDNCTWLDHHLYCKFREITDEP